MVKIGDENSVISVNKILDKPFKHAGGFQIFKNLMAIGIEDNTDKNRSKVFIYRLESPENPPNAPYAIIEREGKEKRATAGCVGIIEVNDDLLVVVGDWDSRHLDIYRMQNKNLILNDKLFKRIYSIDAETIDKSNWINDSWLAYQNINLIKDSSDNLYLAGMASNSSKENILDLFKIDTENYTEFSLRKIYSKKFPFSEYVKFQWGGGIHLTEDNQLKVFLCGAHIKEVSKIIIYE